MLNINIGDLVIHKIMGNIGYVLSINVYAFSTSRSYNIYWLKHSWKEIELKTISECFTFPDDYKIVKTKKDD